MRRPLVVISLFVALLLAACGGGGSNNASTGTTVASSTTTLPPTTATTQVPPPTVPTAPITIPTHSNGVSANGSGCAPPAGPKLPDGIWFGDLKSVDTSAQTIGLDLNCFYVGDAANKAAQQDGGTEIPVPNDYYIRNKVHTIYTLALVSNVAVFKLSAQGGGPLVASGNGAAAAASMLAEFNNFWIGWVQIVSGQVVTIQQQFVP